MKLLHKCYYIVSVIRTVKALQNLSQFLQNFKPASLFGQSRETFSRMLEVLAELRLEGHSSNKNTNKDTIIKVARFR